MMKRHAFIKGRVPTRDVPNKPTQNDCEFYHSFNDEMTVLRIDHPLNGAFWMEIDLVELSKCERNDD